MPKPANSKILPLDTCRNPRHQAIVRDRLQGASHKNLEQTYGISPAALHVLLRRYGLLNGQSPIGKLPKF